MPYTLSNLMNSGAQLGMGSWLRIGVTGDIVAGDFLTCEIYRLGEHATGSSIVSSSATWASNHTGFSGSVANWFGCNRRVESPTFISSIGPMQGNWPEEGEAIEVFTQLIHSFSVVASDNTIGFTWRHAAGQGNLVALMFDQMLSGGVYSGLVDDIAAIRAAVIREFPPS